MTTAQLLLLAAVLGAALAALVFLLALRLRARARHHRLWRRMLAEVEFFRDTLLTLFRRQGFAVHGHWIHQDPLDETPREVVFALERAGTRYAALCVRWLVPVTSDVIGRFDQALAATHAHIGIIVTTSVYTEAALERARGLPVELYDRNHLQRWIARAWP